MIDYGRPLEFGIFPTPDAADYSGTLALAQQADALGLDLIGIQDHPYQSRFFDTWTLLTAIATQTERVRVFSDVANLPLRSPAVLAKSATTLDQISGGRVELGLGAGGFWDANKAMGGPSRTPQEAVAALEEAIAVIRLMWSEQRSVRFDGQVYQLRGAHPGPRPAHPMGIWLGAYGPRMLALTGRLADGWVPSLPYAPPARLPAMHQRIDAAAVQAGRDPAAIRRICNISGRITDGSSRGLLNGPVDQWVEELTTLTVVYGMDSYVLMLGESPAQQL